MDLIGIVAVVGGALLAAALLFALVSNKRRSALEKAGTQQATKDLYAKVDRQDKLSDPDAQTF